MKKFADGLATEGEVESAKQAVIAACERNLELGGCQGMPNVDAAAEEVKAQAVYAARPTNFDPNDREQSLADDEESWRALDEEKAVQCVLFRCVFGNPFRPVEFVLDWRTSKVVMLAQGIYESAPAPT